MGKDLFRSFNSLEAWPKSSVQFVYVEVILNKIKLTLIIKMSLLIFFLSNHFCLESSIAMLFNLLSKV